MGVVSMEKLKALAPSLATTGGLELSGENFDAPRIFILGIMHLVAQLVAAVKLVMIEETGSKINERRSCLNRRRLRTQIYLPYQVVLCYPV